MAKISKKNGKLIDQDQTAYLRICEMLFKNELNPKQKISYKELATRIGVSTTPVIHALKRLEYKGILRREPNKGHFINTIVEQDVEEIFDIRSAVEVMLLPKTITLLNKKGVEKLEIALEEHDVAITLNDRFRRVMTDLRFHMVLAALSKTNTQIAVLEDLFDLMLLRYSKSLFYYGMTESSQKEHHAIFEAVTKKDLATSQKYLGTHLKNVKHHILQDFEKQSSKSKKDFIKYQSFEDIKNGNLLA